MDLAGLRAKIRAIIFAITGFIEAFLFLRITLDLISADSNNVVVSFISQITNPLIYPFEGLITLPQTGILTYFNEAAIVAFIVYILASIAFAEIITAFLYDNFKDLFQNVIDALFKFLESFLILRILFDLFAVGLSLGSPLFVKLVYGTTEWAQGIIFDQPFLSGRINLSTLLCLIIVVIIDLLTERFLDTIFIQVTEITKKVNVKLPSLPKTNFKTLIPKMPTRFKNENKESSSEVIQPNITINIPVPESIGNTENLPKPEVIIENQVVETSSSAELNQEKKLPTLQNPYQEGWLLVAQKHFLRS